MVIGVCYSFVYDTAAIVAVGPAAAVAIQIVLPLHQRSVLGPAAMRTGMSCAFETARGIHKLAPQKENMTALTIPCPRRSNIAIVGSQSHSIRDYTVSIR